MFLIGGIALVAPLQAAAVQAAQFQAVDLARDVQRPVHGRLLDQTGAPLAGWWVGALRSWNERHREPEERCRTDEDGRFRLDPSPATPFALSVRSPASVHPPVVVIREDFGLDGGELELRLRPEDWPTAFLEGQWLGPHSPEERLLCRAPEGTEEQDAVFTGDRFRIGPLPAGEYELVACRDNYLSFPFAATTVPSTTRDIGPLKLDSLGFVAVTLERGGVELDADYPVITDLYRDGLRCGRVYNHVLPWGMCGLAAMVPIELGRSQPLVAGRYLLRTHGPSWFAHDRLIEVVGERTTEVVLRLEPATTRTFVVRVPDRDPSIRAHLVIDLRDGTRFSEAENVNRRGGSFTFDVASLIVASYRVRATTPAGSRWEGEFEVTGPEEGSQMEIVLE